MAKIYVSSTYLDLQEHRAQVVRFKNLLRQ
jgi:hypothetical protein